MVRLWSLVNRDKGSPSSLPHDLDERDRLKWTCLVAALVLSQRDWELGSKLCLLSEPESVSRSLLGCELRLPYRAWEVGRVG